VAHSDFDDNPTESLANWDQVAGDWSTTGSEPLGYWCNTTDNDALLIHSLHAVVDGEQYITCKIMGSTAGDQLRIIMGYVDEDNWCAVEYEFGDGAGVMRFLESTTTGGIEQLGDDVPIKIHLGVWYDVIACLHDGIITGRWETVDDVTGGYEDEERTILQYRDTTVDGDQAGFGTGTCTGTASFDEFTFYIHRCETPGYTDCPQGEQTCVVWFNGASHHSGDTESDDLDDPYWETSGTGGWEWNPYYQQWRGTPDAWAICQVPQSYDKQGQYIHATINPQGDNYGEVRTTWLIGDYVDADNFHALKVEWTEGTYRTYVATVIKRTSGSDATVATFNNYWSTGFGFPSMSLCVMDDAVMGTVSTATGTTTSNVRGSTSHGGRLAGMAVTGSYSASFMGWTYERHYGTGIDGACDRCGGTWLCGENWATCVGGTVPMYMKVALDGFVNGVDGYDDDGRFIGACDSCDNLNGIYVAKLYYTNEAMCSYLYEPFPTDCLYVAGYHRIIVNIYQYGTGYNRIDVSVWFDGYYGNPDVSYSKYPWSGDCSSIEDMELTLSGSSSVACDTTSSTCFITAIT
jgi:hypothetical protein